jgi:hypothetical protein
MAICVREGLVSLNDSLAGYTKGLISTPEFTATELQIVRAFEWDRINFKTPQKIEQVARMEGLTISEVDDWRRRTRKSLGSTIGWKE